MTIQEIRDQVVACILTFVQTELPLKERPEKIPTHQATRNTKQLHQLGISSRYRYKLGLYLTRRNHCRHLDPTCTYHWKTVEDVVTTVIAHPVPTHRSHHRR